MHKWGVEAGLALEMSVQLHNSSKYNICVEFMSPMMTARCALIYNTMAKESYQKAYTSPPSRPILITVSKLWLDLYLH